MLYKKGEEIKCECLSEEFIFLDEDMFETERRAVFVQCEECGELEEIDNLMDEEELDYQKDIDKEDWDNFINRND